MSHQIKVETHTCCQDQSAIDILLKYYLSSGMVNIRQRSMTDCTDNNNGTHTYIIRPII